MGGRIGAASANSGTPWAGSGCADGGSTGAGGSGVVGDLRSAHDVAATELACPDAACSRRFSGAGEFGFVDPGRLRSGDARGVHAGIGGYGGWIVSDTIDMVALARYWTWARVASFVELTKPRIAVLVLVATLMGFCLAVAAGVGPTSTGVLVHVLIGTALAAGGANAVNQYVEAEHDARMVRTRNRPIPSGRLSSEQVLFFGVAGVVIGTVYITVTATLLAGFLTATSFLIYIFAYTPLKRVTPTCVFVGAVPGALPPVIGWAAATGTVSLEAWLLFGIVFFWQLPHFAAIAWLYREDYARAGFVVLPAVDAGGIWTDLHIVTHTVTLLVVSFLPVVYGLAGPLYAVGAMALGLGFLGSGALFVARKTALRARVQVIASVIYLPCLLSAMVIDKLPFP